MTLDKAYTVAGDQIYVYLILNAEVVVILLDSFHDASAELSSG